MRCSDYHGIHFAKRLQMLDDLHTQRAEIATYFRKFDDAEKLYNKGTQVGFVAKVKNRDEQFRAFRFDRIVSLARTS